MKAKQKYNINKFLKDLTLEVTVTGIKTFGLKWRIALILIKISVRILNCRIRITY